MDPERPWSLRGRALHAQDFRKGTGHLTVKHPLLVDGLSLVGVDQMQGKGMKQIMKAMTLGIGVVVLTACSNASAPQGNQAEATSSDLSGTYVAAGQDATSHYFVEALRLTPSGPGQFSGSFETTSLDAAGKVSSASQNVTGATDGQQVTVTFDQMLGHTNRTGAMTAQGLTLSWSENGQLNHEAFIKKTDAEYGQLLDTMKQRSVVLDAQEQQRQTAETERKQATALTERVNRFLQKFPTWTVASQEVRHSHAMMVAKGGLAQVQRLMRGGDVARSQAQVTVGQLQVAHDQLGLAISNDQRELDEAKRKLAALDADVVRTSCLNPDGTLAAQAVAECAALPKAVRSYRETRPKADAFMVRVVALNRQTDTEFVEVLHQAEQAAGMSLSH